MLKPVTCCVYIFVLLTSTRCQVSFSSGADLSHLAQTYQTAGPNAHHRPVVVRCHPDSWEVVVQADLFNTGIMVEGGHLRLGVEQRRDPSACRAAPSGPTEFTIRAHLLDCGTAKLPPTKDRIIYSNVLVYSPEPSADGLLRLDGASIPVECHYDKFYSVKTLTLLPTWAPFVSRTTAESQIDFNLRLMTGDWQFERKSHLYYVGDPIHFEVSSNLGNHKPLRVFVDHCVATATPDPEATLRYDFIDHHGCLADAYLTNSSARFLSRTDDYKIQFQLDAFTFYQEKTNQIYITCVLSAVPSLADVKSKHKACSLIDNRWHSADGDDDECTSCSIPYPHTKSANRASSAARSSVRSEQPFTSRGLNINVHPPVTYMLIRQRTRHSTVGLTREGEKKGTLKLGPLIILQKKASDFSRQ